jgi:lipid-A-disaccharide synthase
VSGILVVAVEASGDLHGAAVLRELRALRPDLQAFGAGGPRMRAEGFEALVRAEDLSVMGIVEVLPKLPQLFEAMDTLKDAARERKPLLALLIDSPDFNLRLAKRLKQLRIPVAYFIGPTVWAWRTYRVKQIARDIARMLVILPFEAAFYAKHGVEARYVGNPLADELRRLPAGADRAGAREAVFGAPVEKVLALLPGSRLQEIHRLWPPMLAAARKLQASMPGLRLVVPIASTLERALFGYAPDVQFVASASQALAAADAAIVASGTATLEAALAGVPQVVVYRTSWLSWMIGRMLIRVRFISLPNLLAGRALVPELLQSRCTATNIAEALSPLLTDGPEREAQLEGLRAVRAELLPPGAPSASRRAAEEVLALLGGASA